MNMPASRLIVRRGKTPEPEYTLSEQTVVIGREAINDIMFQELEISRRHASISFSGGKYLIEDLNSTNGTFVNGRRISTPVVLTSGDVVDLGDNVSFIFQSGAPATDQTRVDSSPKITDEATVQGSGASREPVYAPPPDVPQYGEQPPAPPPSTWQTDQKAAATPDPTQYSAIPPAAEQKDRRQLYIGCGCLILLVVVGCIATFAFLDSYQGGDLLYCQTFKPIWEVIFGASRVAAGCQ
ncbi:MAG: FHA domain-containing protein [Candidatus Promineifilaceae bacterium]